MQVENKDLKGNWLTWVHLEKWSLNGSSCSCCFFSDPCMTVGQPSLEHVSQLKQWRKVVVVVVVAVAVIVCCCCCYLNRLPVVEVLSRHIDSVASCLRSVHCDSVIVLQLLSLLKLPNNADISRLTRLSHHVIFCFFTAMRQQGKLFFLFFFFSFNFYDNDNHPIYNAHSAEKI